MIDSNTRYRVERLTLLGWRNAGPGGHDFNFLWVAERCLRNFERQRPKARYRIRTIT